MRPTRYWIVGVTGLLALVFSGAAWGKCGTHHTKGNPTVSQYVEQMHTSCGSTAAGSTTPGSTTGGGGSVTLSRSITSRLHRTSSGAELKSLATDTALGAQPKDLRGDVGALGGGNPLSASVGALGGGSGARLLLLLGLMGGAAVALLAASIFRRRSSR